MKKRVILISIDGMRPDGLKQCGNPFLSELEGLTAHTYSASSVNPSVTLPCHFSMSHGVTPERHGITTNTYTPQVRPILGIFEVIKAARGVSAMFYGWEPLRDIARPGSLKFATYISARFKEYVDDLLTDEAIKTIDSDHPDFVFLYMVETDEKGGHDNGWMSEEYLRRISIAIDNVKRIFERYADEYSIIIMSDHGGHARSHGTTMPEDMTVPLFIYDKDVAAGELGGEVSIIDIAPTIADLMGLEPEEEWEGRSLVKG